MVFRVTLLGLLLIPVTTGLSVVSYNIMDSGFASDSGKYDPVGDRVPGNLTDYVFGMNQFVDVLGVIETSLWGEGGDGVPSKVRMRI